MVARAVTGSPESVLWIERGEEIPPRIVASMVDQPSRSRVLLYGGWNVDSGVRSDTWEWDGVGWIRRVPENDPGPRFAAATVFDDIGQRVLLFGGLKTLIPLPLGADRRTWEWNGVDWSPIITAHAPSERAASALAWDPRTRRVLLFGGFSGNAEVSGTATSDDAFWSFDGRDWTEIPKTTPWPTPRGLGSMVIDRRTGRLVLTGGFNFITFVGGNLDFASGTRYIDDTWEWDGSTWTQIPAVLAETGLSAPVLTSEPATGELTLFVDTLQRSALYTLVDGRWTVKQERDPKEVFSSAAFSSKNQAVLVTGGSGRDSFGVPNGEVARGDYLVSSTQAFRRLPDAVEAGARMNAAGATVRSTGELVVFGGVDEAARQMAKTLVWDGGRWRTPKTPDPATLKPRIRHAMAPLGTDQVLLFGGSSAGQLTDETWVWSATTEAWTLDERTGPSARINSTMAAFGDSVVLFGGDAGSDNISGDTWVYNPANGWTPRAPTSAPPGRTLATASTGLDEGSILLYGGMLAGNKSSGEMWRFSANTWQLVADYAPLVRRRGHIARDRALGRIYVVGGTASSTLADLWDLTEPVGRPVAPLLLEDNQELPLRRHDAVFAESPRTGGVTLFGGQSNDGDRAQSDTWQAVSFGAPCTDASECSAGQACTEGVCCETSNCGPCRTCAGPDRPGLCTPRGVFGPAPGCDLPGQACNVRGLCRLDNEQACDDDLACASNTCLIAGRDAGICCAAEGCTLRCIEGNLRGPDGNTTSCAPYGCTVDRCNTVCGSIEDCAAGFVCDENKACVPLQEPVGGDSGCSCRVVENGTRSGASVALLGLVLLTLRRRRETRSPARSRVDPAPH